MSATLANNNKERRVTKTILKLMQVLAISHCRLSRSVPLPLIAFITFRPTAVHNINAICTNKRHIAYKSMCNKHRH